MNIGAKIRELRKEAGLSQRELADRVGLHKNSMSLIEQGDHIPQRRNRELIAEVLGVPVNTLFEPPKSAEEEPPKGSFRMPEYFGDDEEYAQFEKDIQGLDLEELAEFGRALLVEWRVAEKGGNDAGAADLEAKRARVSRRIRELNPPAWTLSARQGGPIKVTFYREPTEEEWAELQKLQESIGRGLIEDRRLLALAV
jgi:transcriptional regulator with XRE-family HTH domain